MTSRKIDMSIPNVPYPTSARGLVLGADGKIPLSVIPEGVGGGIDMITTTTPTNLTGMLKGNGTDVDVATAGVDYVTPGGMTTADNLKVDKDSVVVAATRLVATKLLAGDAQPAFRIMGDGKMQWGQGGASATDVDLYRFASNLRTPQSIYADLGFIARPDISSARIDIATSNVKATMLFGSDTNLYRDSGGNLNTDANFTAAGNIRATLSPGDAQPQIQLVRNAYGAGQPAIQFGQGGTTAPDTNLYRRSAGFIATDGASSVGTGLYVGQSVSTPGSAGYGIAFGGASDTNLYRSNLNALKTDGSLQVSEAIYGNKSVNVDYTGGGYRLYFGQAPPDTSLYRYGAGIIASPGRFWVGGGTTPGNGDIWLWASGDGWPRIQLLNNGYLQWGPGTAGVDTNLYRAAAGKLKTDGNLDVGGVLAATSYVQAAVGAANMVTLGHAGAAGVIAGMYFGNGADTNLYRAAASTLKTDGYLQVAGSIALDLAGASYKLYFGSAQDTNLYRSAAGDLRTDGRLTSIGGMVLDINQTSQKLYFGGSGDTNLYRSGASTLTTDGNLVVGSNLSVGGVINILTAGGFANAISLGVRANGMSGARTVEVGPVDSGGSGYRVLRIGN